MLCCGGISRLGRGCYQRVFGSQVVNLSRRRVLCVSTDSVLEDVLAWIVANLPKQRQLYS